MSYLKNVKCQNLHYNIPLFWYSKRMFTIWEYCQKANDYRIAPLEMLWLLWSHFFFFFKAFSLANFFFLILTISIVSETILRYKNCTYSCLRLTKLWRLSFLIYFLLLSGPVAVQAVLVPPRIDCVPWNITLLNEQYLIETIYFLWKILVILVVV